MINITSEVRDSVFYLKEDPRVKGWFLLDSPVILASLISAYLLFVKKFGPAIMAMREEFQLKKFMMFYNVLQIVYCGLLVLFVIFVLRKKDNQISFLHTFHHVYAVVLGYVNTKYIAGTQIPLLTFWNSLVHVLMYYYYMQTSLSKKTIWWKKYLTIFQLLQLGIFISCMLPSLLRPSCEFPKFPIFLIMFLPTALLVSEFSRFYLKSYKKVSHLQKMN